MPYQIIKNQIEAPLETGWRKLNRNERYVDIDGVSVSAASNGRKYKVLAEQARYYSSGEVCGAVLAVIFSLGLALLSPVIKHMLFHKKMAGKLFVERYLNDNDKAHKNWLEQLKNYGFEGKYDNYFAGDLNSPDQIATYFAEAYRQIPEEQRPSYDAAVAQALEASDAPSKDQIIEKYQALIQEMGSKSNLLICKYGQLSRKQQKLVLDMIDKLNRKINTDPTKSKNWDDYTDQIQHNVSACKNAKNTLFIAKYKGEFAGYAAFYTPKDRLSCTKSLDYNQAYCAWIAIDECARGLGLGSLLLQKIFENDSVSSFNAEVRESNKLSQMLFTNMANKGFKVTTDRASDGDYEFTVHRKP